jgi:anti-anti-sigma regulatory factor
VVIDLTGCSEVDAAGLNALVGAAYGVHGAGGDLELVGANGLVREALAVGGAGNLLGYGPEPAMA